MPDQPFDRRELLKRAGITGVAGLSPLVSASAISAAEASASRKRNRIHEENEKPGTTDWQLTRVMVNKGSYRTSLIEGYCDRQSVAAGETLSICVSTDPARQYALDIYRLGYYGGTGGRHMLHVGPLLGETQPIPEMTAEPERLRECQWKPTCSITIPEDWLSGVYLGKLTTIPDSPAEPYWQSYVIFIVRDQRKADLLFQCSDNTWQAYNRWPVNESLYTHPAGAHAPDVSVSFDRPYGKYCQIFENPLSVGSGEFLLWEFPLAYWLEKEGYDVTYGCNCDCISADFIERCRVMLSVGHDEYWDVRQYHAVEHAIQKGVNVLWLCGNSVFVDSPFTGNASNIPLRRLTRKGFFGEVREDEDAKYRSLFAGTAGTAPDERNIMGVRSVVPFNGGGDWTCSNEKHWLFAGTGMKNGDSIPGLVGWEHHGEPDLSLPGMEVVAEGTIWSGGVNPGKYEAVVFHGPQGNLIFNASTIFWAQGLSAPPGHWIPWSHGSRPHGPDPRVQQMTRNLLTRCLGE
ncbi:MAG: hypothetical protein KDA78_08140 [Planctomycetaceae bacterium]|nr:hypothetical protein [Planctomycetaceae bacterium]